MLHKIEIDDDVLNVLKTNAEPFIDMTPNSVLRRLLVSNRTKQKRSIDSVAKHDTPAIESGAPEALQQILEVIYLVKKTGYTRVDATKKVAQSRGIAPQTVIDKYCRQLNKKVFEIDKLLDHDLDMLQSLLKKRFIHHHDVIDKIFLSIQTTESENDVDPRIFRGSIKLTLDEQTIENESKKLRDEWKRAF